MNRQGMFKQAKTEVFESNFSISELLIYQKICDLSRLRVFHSDSSSLSEFPKLHVFTLDSLKCSRVDG